MAGHRGIPMLAAIGTLAIMSSIAHAETQTGFLNRTLIIGNVLYRYQVYVPSEWSKGKKWPTVLFLHGAGERGDDGLLQTQVGIGAAIRIHSDRFPAVVVLVQCRKDRWWLDPDMEEMALGALDNAVREFRGDLDRLYLTGLSMGGYGTWSIAANHPGKFAALAPICGGLRLPSGGPSTVPPGTDGDDAQYVKAAKKLGKTPVWIFHGAADTVIPVSESQKMNDALKASGGNVKYTEYPGVGHNSWDKAYFDPEFMTWMLAQRRSH